MVSQKRRPCRLTVHKPNHDAHSLYAEVMKELFKKRSFWCKYCGIISCSVIGLALSILIWIGPSDTNIRGGFICLLIFLLLGLFIQWLVRKDSTIHSKDKNGLNKPRQIIHKMLESKIQENVKNYQVCLANLQYTTAAQQQLAQSPFPTSSTTSLCYVGKLLPYPKIDKAGCMPPSPVTTYEIAWKELEGRYSSNNNNNSIPINTNAKRVLDLHTKWLDHLQKSLTIAESIVDALQNERQKAAAQAFRNGIGSIFGLPCLDIFSALGDVAELTKQLYDLKGQIGDVKELYDNAPGAIDTPSSEPRKGIHRVLVPRLILQFCVATIFCVPLIVLFALEVGDTSVAGAYGFAAVWLFMIGLCWVMTKGKNTSFNTLEDLYDMEVYVRDCIKYETEKKNPMTAYSDQELVRVTNKLRDLIMDSYYDTLAISIETNLFMAGSPPPTKRTAKPFYWNDNNINNPNTGNTHTSPPGTTPAVTTVITSTNTGGGSSSGRVAGASATTSATNTMGNQIGNLNPYVSSNKGRQGTTVQARNNQQQPKYGNAHSHQQHDTIQYGNADGDHQEEGVITEYGNADDSIVVEDVESQQQGRSTAVTTRINPQPVRDDDDDEWVCPQCTLRNPTSRKACDACQFRHSGQHANTNTSAPNASHPPRRQRGIDEGSDSLMPPPRRFQQNDDNGVSSPPDIARPVAQAEGTRRAGNQQTYQEEVWL